MGLKESGKGYMENEELKGGTGRKNAVIKLESQIKNK